MPRGGVVTPALIVTIRGTKALVKGYEAMRATRMTAPEGVQPPWSKAGHGYVIRAEQVPDVLAYAQQYHLLAVVSDITPAAAEEVAS
jgi:hypothetical protein